MNKIDLTLYFKDYKYFSGRENGKDTRKSLKLDERDEKKEKIIFYIKSDLIGMNVSFFLGLFSKTIRKCGIEDFKKRYIFEYEDPSRNKELFEKDIEYGIENVLDEITPEKLIDRLTGENNK